MFEIHVQLTKETYGKVSAAMQVRRFLYIYLIVALLTVVVILNFILTPPPSIKWQDFIAPAIFVLLFAGLPALQRWFGLGWKNYPVAAQPVTYRLSEEGLTADGEIYHSFQEWSNFVGIRQVSAAVVLFFTRNQVYIFPNESFLSVQERDNVVAFIRQHIPTDKKRMLRLPTVKWFAMMVGLWFAIVIGVYIVLTVFHK